MLGFTEEEVRNLLELYRDYGVFSQDVEAAMDSDARVVQRLSVRQEKPKATSTTRTWFSISSLNPYRTKEVCRTS